MAQQMPLTDLPRILTEAGYETPNYRALYEAARSARIPVAKDAGGRWTFFPDDLASIADEMGLAQKHAA